MYITIYFIRLPEWSTGFVFKIMELLDQYGSAVEYNDPYIPIIKTRREHNQFEGKKSVSLDIIGSFDLVVILTDHSCYHYEEIVRDAKLIVDTRNACGKIKSDKIIKAWLPQA